MAINFLKSISFGRLVKTDKTNVLVLVAIWFLMLTLVNPLGNFPLNDDWVYGLSVQSILEKGDFRLPAQSSSNVFAQVYWGALFCLPFGFSFTALRFSTLTLGLVGVLVTYALLREVHVNSKKSLIGALLVAFNPIYFGLSNTFMTDVPFFAFFVLSFYFLIRGLRRDSSTEITIGITTSYIALLIRQFGLIIPLVFGFAYLAKKGISLKTFIKGFIPLLLGLSIQVLYTKWLYTTGRTLPLKNLQYEGFLNGLQILAQGGRVLAFIKIFMYLGFFIFPFIIVFSSEKFNSPQKRSSLIALLTFSVVAMGISAWQNKGIPFAAGNVLVTSGLGPLTLQDTFGFNINYPFIPLALKIFWAVVTGISVFGAALLLNYLWIATVSSFTQHKASNFVGKSWLRILIIPYALIYIFIISSLPYGMVFDRYFLLLLPLFMIAILMSTEDSSKDKVRHNMISLALIILLAYGGFTIGATHDYLAWNRARWQSLYNLMQEDNILPNQIDGGYEFNGWHNPNKIFMDNTDYIISFGPLAGYEEVKRYPFKRWLLFREDNIFVLHKTAGRNNLPLH